jgi:hypothetical protein
MKRLRIESLESRRLLHDGPAIVNPYTVPLDSAYYGLNFERVYNFAHDPTAETVAPGDWSDPHIWSTGVVPTGGRVHVNYETTISQKLSGVYEAVAVNPGAELSFDPTQNTRLEVGTLMVMWGGALEIGTADRPIADNVTAEIVIDDRPLNTTVDPAQHGTGLLILGGRIETNGRNNTSFVEFAVAPAAGATTLVLAQPVTGWLPGDQVFIPDTRGGANNAQAEFATIQSTSGNVVTLTQPLKFSHAGLLDQLPHVAHLGGNIIVRSENPTGTRGHVLVTERSTVDVQDAVFKDLGRTTVAQLDNTQLSSTKETLHVGTNQVGRYSFHQHHVYNPFTFKDNVIVGGEKWGLAVHDTHYGLIEDNVVVDVEGAGIVFEDGSETGNIVRHNFTGLHKGSGQAETVRANGTDAVNVGDGSAANPYRTVGDNGHAGTGIWSRGSNNIYVDNVTVNAAASGMFMWTRFATDRKIPKFKGADPRVQGVLSDIGAQVPMEFARNESYGTPLGFRFGGVAQTSPTNYVVSDLTAWAATMGVEVIYSGDMVFDGLTLRTNLLASTGIQAGVSTQYVAANNLDIRGFVVGMALASATDIRDSYFDSTKIDLQLSYTAPGHWDRGALSRTNEPAVLTNVRFGGRSQQTIAPTYPAVQLTNNQSMTYPRDVLVYDYNGVASDDFQIFMAEQAATYVMPFSGIGPAAIGTTRFSPVQNSTNQQLWDTYRIAVSGRVMPADAVARPKINGRVAPIPTDIQAPTISNVQVVVSATSATITWDTSEPATTQLEWTGNPMIVQGAYGNLTQAVTTLTTSHTVTLTGLTPGATYRYEPRSTDAAGNTGGYDVPFYSTDPAKHNSLSFTTPKGVLKAQGMFIGPLEPRLVDTAFADWPTSAPSRAGRTAETAV